LTNVGQGKKILARRTKKKAFEEDSISLRRKQRT